MNHYLTWEKKLWNLGRRIFGSITEFFSSTAVPQSRILGCGTVLQIQGEKKKRKLPPTFKSVLLATHTVYPPPPTLLPPRCVVPGKIQAEQVHILSLLNRPGLVLTSRHNKGGFRGWLHLHNKLLSTISYCELYLLSLQEHHSQIHTPEKTHFKLHLARIFSKKYPHLPKSPMHDIFWCWQMAVPEN